MKKMFPSGVDESRREVDYARKAFDEDKDKDHTAHPRNQHHHEPKQPAAEHRASTATRTNGEASDRAQHADGNGDVAMEDADRTDDDGRSTREQSDALAPYPDSASHEEPAPSVQQDKMSTWPDSRSAENVSSTASASAAKVKDHGVEPGATTEVKTQEPDSS
jgi:hypothetical protein